MIIKSLTLLAALSSAHAASHVAADLIRFSTRLAPRALPAYIAPPLVLHGELFTHRWMSSTPIKAPEMPKPIIHDLEEPLTTLPTAPALATAPKKLLELPDELYDRKDPGRSVSRIMEYIEKNNLEKEFREKVRWNCTGDIAELAGGNDKTFIYCAEKIKEYAALDLEGLRALEKHRFTLFEDVRIIKSSLINKFIDLKYLTPEGEIASSLPHHEMEAIENSLTLIKITLKNIGKI